MTDSSPIPPLLIVGTGAMACLFAARLSAAGIPPLMLGSWAEGLETLAKNGVTIVENDGREQSYPVRVTSDLHDCQGLPYALVLVKSWQTEAAGFKLAQCLPENGLALSLQNGMGNRELLSAILGASRVALGATTAGAYLVAPGKVRPAGEGVVTMAIHSRLNLLTDLLGKAGFVVETMNDLSTLLWGKLVINSAINPITALLRVPNGELVERPSARSLLTSIARESAAIAIAKGVHLPYPDPVVATEAIARHTAQNYSSMLQDVLRGAPTEIDAICGAIVKAGEQTHVPAPINRSMWMLVNALRK